MSLIRITPPAVEPVSLDEVKLQARINAGTGEDALLTAYIQAAREMAEHELGRALITQTWEQRLDAFPAGDIGIKLGRAKALSIVQVQYNDPTEALQTMDAGSYLLDAAVGPGWLMPADGAQWPDTAEIINAVRVRFTCGYGPAASDVPAAIRNWILVTVAALYTNREALDASGRARELPARFIDRLLDAERIYD